MQTNSTCYKGTGTMTIKGVLWHSTGCNNTTLRRWIQPSENDPNYSKLMNLIGKNYNNNDWNHIYVEAGLNAWIGKLADGTVAAVQSMPWNYRPWGCGSGSKGSCNNGWIQFEICEDGLTDANYFNKVYQEACELTAYLCKTYNIDPHGYTTLNGVKVPTILCHADSHTLGLGSGHADVLHWFPKFGKNMDNVRNDVAALLSGKSGSGFQPYIGKVNAKTGLNCRKTPSTSGELISTIPYNTEITISKEQSGWGYTSAYKGWVSLQYVTTIKVLEEEEDMTSERFAELMNEWLETQAKKDPSSWSKKDRQWAESNGIIAGDQNGNKMYKKFITREEAVAILHRAVTK